MPSASPDATCKLSVTACVEGPAKYSYEVRLFSRRYCRAQHSLFEGAFGWYVRSGLSTCKVSSVKESFAIHVSHFKGPFSVTK